MLHSDNAVRESANKSAASAASPDYVKFQAVIKSAASAASHCVGRASGRLDNVFFFAILGRASGQKIVKISDFAALATSFNLPHFLTDPSAPYWSEAQSVRIFLLEARANIEVI